MPSSDRVAAAVAQRIRNSGHVLVVVYPEVRPVMTGSSPTATPPIAPLTGGRSNEPTASPTARHASVSLPCLWYDAYGNFVISLQQDQRRQRLPAYAQDANAIARVLVSDAVLDADDPSGDTVFTGAEFAEYRGHRYRILGWDGIGAGFGPSNSFHVWLRGAQKQ